LRIVSPPARRRRADGRHRLCSPECPPGGRVHARLDRCGGRSGGRQVTTAGGALRSVRSARGLRETRMRLVRYVLGLAVGLGVANATFAQAKPRRLLVIGQSKGYEHDSISTAMATLYNIGRRSQLWETFFRTDCAAITKKPRKWGAKNLDAFDAVAFFT